MTTTYIASMYVYGTHLILLDMCIFNRNLIIYYLFIITLLIPFRQISCKNSVIQPIAKLTSFAQVTLQKTAVEWISINNNGIAHSMYNLIHFVC